MGLSLLILFNQFPFADQPNGTVESWFRAVGIEVTNTKLAVVIAQFTISTAFAIRTMKIVFDQIPQRSEEIAMTMGASRGRAGLARLGSLDRFLFLRELLEVRQKC